MAMSQATSDALALVARRPRLPVKYMALLLDEDAGALELRLLRATHEGLLREIEAGCCCGSLFEATAAGARFAVAARL